MNTRPLCLLLLSLLALATGAAGGDKPAIPEVEVAQPLVREVSDYEDFDGRTEASATVQIKARVSGYIDKVFFKEGAEVKKDDLLFELDPTPYKTVLKRAEAAVALGQTVLSRADAEYRRGRALLDRKAIDKDELDRLAAARDEARARLHLAKADRDAASIRLGYARVTAPISGRIGRRLFDAGSLVKADETTLATIVSLKPISVNFHVPERTALRVQRIAAKEKGKGIPVAMGFADENGFPNETEVDYIHHCLEGNMGTLRLRAALPNADGLLVSGLSVRIRLTTSKPQKALLVPERAVGRFGAGRYVVVVTQEDEFEDREIQLGHKHGDLRIVEKGLTASDWVVLAWPREMRAGTKVKPKKVAMPAGKR